MKRDVFEGQRSLFSMERLRKLPPQILLIALVLAAGIASVVVSRIRSAYTAGSAVAQEDQDGPTAPERAGALAPAAPAEEGPSPSRPVEEAFDAARRGDIDGYLAHFTEPLHTRLARARAEKGDAYLRDYLDRLTKPMLGIAADLTRKETVGPETLRLPIHFVYKDRDETQTYVVQRVGSEWKISQIEPARSVPTQIPYGTPLDQVLPAAPTAPPSAVPSGGLP